MKLPYALIVEDEQWLAEQYARTLRHHQVRSHCVSDVLAAIESIDNDQPDVIILDILLVGPTAFTLLNELRSHSDLINIPIILCTSQAQELSLEFLKPYGVRQVLDKTTMHPEDIVAAVRKVLV